MKQEQLKENQEKIVELPELANWIKEKYPQEFILQIEFEEGEDRDGRK